MLILIRRIDALIVQWIEYGFAEPVTKVQFLVGALSRKPCCIKIAFIVADTNM